MNLRHVSGRCSKAGRHAIFSALIQLALISITQVLLSNKMCCMNVALVVMF
jgi:hypothetical protein